MRYMLTDELWAVLGPHVAAAKRYTCGSAPVLPDRLFFEAVLYWARTGIPWRDLPAEFGRWDAVYNRLRRWVYSGSLQALFERLTADPQLGEVRRVLIDSDHRPRPPARGRGKAAEKRSGRAGRQPLRVWAGAGAG